MDTLFLIIDMLILIVPAGFVFYRIATRKAPIDAGRNSSVWHGNSLLFWPYVKRRLHSHPALRHQPFLYGITSGILFGVTLLLNIAIVLLLLLSVSLLFNAQAGGLVFVPLLLALPWAKLLGSQFNSPFLSVALGIAVNIGLLGLGWGIYSAALSKLKDREP